MIADANMFSDEERRRYSRHLQLPGFTEAEQQRLKKGRVLVVGAGGLGCPVLLYLAAAGVGHLTIVDDDRVSLDNLQRQVLYLTSDIGLPKAEVAAARLRERNPHIEVEAVPTRLRVDRALEWVSRHDVVLDCTDNFPARYLLNDACVLADRPLVYGALFRWEGQVSVFHALRPDGVRGPNYRDLYPHPPTGGWALSCAEAGVLGALAGVVGSAQATETIKILTGLGHPLIGRLWVFDLLTSEGRTFSFSHRANNPITGERPTQTTLIDYDLFCGSHEIEAGELTQWIDEGRPLQWVDVRSAAEHAAGHLGGENIPLAALDSQYHRIPRDRVVVCYCQSGVRSAQATARLRQHYGFTQVFSLRGGLASWRDASSSPGPSSLRL